MFNTYNLFLVPIEISQDRKGDIHFDVVTVHIQE